MVRYAPQLESDPFATVLRCWSGTACRGVPPPWGVMAGRRERALIHPEAHHA